MLWQLVAAGLGSFAGGLAAGQGVGQAALGGLMSGATAGFMAGAPTGVDPRAGGSALTEYQLDKVLLKEHAQQAFKLLPSNYCCTWMWYWIVGRVTDHFMDQAALMSAWTST